MSPCAVQTPLCLGGAHHVTAGPRGAPVLGAARCCSVWGPVARPPHGRRCLAADLSKNGIGVKGVVALAEALAQNDALQALVLDTNSAGDEGAEVLAKHLSRALPLLLLLLLLSTLGPPSVALPSPSRRRTGAQAHRAPAERVLFSCLVLALRMQALITAASFAGWQHCFWACLQSVLQLSSAVVVEASKCSLQYAGHPKAAGTAVTSCVCRLLRQGTATSGG